MKIAYFLGTLKKEDGVTRVLLSLINEANKKGDQTIVVTGWAEDESICPTKIIQVPSFIFPLYKDYKIPYPGMHGFEKQLDEFKPDIIHVHSPETIAWAAAKYAKKNKIPIVATYHTNFNKYLPYYHLSFLHSFVWFILRKIYKKMDFITVPSESTREDLIYNGIKNVYIVPWGVEIKKFNPTFRSIEWRNNILDNKDGKIILCVCRLTWEKDLKTLASVFALLKKNQTNLQMVIVGDGPARKELEAQMRGAIFLGHLEGLELSKIYASADIFLFPSHTETFGNVTIEAMSSGLVCVVADAGGSKSLVKNNINGFLAQSKNVDDFYKKVCILLENKKLYERMKNNSLNFIKDYTWIKTYDNLLQKYYELLP